MEFLRAILINKTELKQSFDQISVRKDSSTTIKVTVKTIGFKENKVEIFNTITINKSEYIVVLENTYLWDLIKNTGNMQENKSVKQDAYFNLNDVL